MTVTIAQGSRTQMLHKMQSGFGVTATGDYAPIKFNTHSLKLDIGGVKSAMIRSDREVQDFRHTIRDTSGDVDVELCYADHDLLLRSAMFSDFVGSTLKIGTTPQFLSIEDGALDIAIYNMFSSQLCSKMALKMAPAAIVQAKFTFVGADMATSGASGGGTPSARSSNQPFDSLTGAIYDDPAESGSALAVVTALDLNIDNTAKVLHAIGNKAAIAAEFGRGDVSGQMTLFYGDNTWITRYINEAEFGLSFSLTDPAGHGMEFQMGRVKGNGASPPVANEQARMITVPFQALLPSSGPLTSALSITKF